MVQSMDRKRTDVAAKEMASLLHRVGQDRDREAFRVVFDHFAPRIRAFLIGRKLTPARADDLTQEALLNVWRRADRYDPGKAAASTWIYAIARNLHIDHYRKVQRQVLDEDDPHFHLDDTPDAQELVERSEDVGAITEALASLPEEQREVIKLSFTEGQSHQEIAETLALPLGTVKSRIRLALGRLRSVLGDEE